MPGAIEVKCHQLSFLHLFTDQPFHLAVAEHLPVNPGPARDLHQVLGGSIFRLASDWSPHRMAALPDHGHR